MLLPFAFALHNFEEALSMEKWTKSLPDHIHKPVTTRQFGIAVLLFSILGFAVTLTKGFYRTEQYYYLVIAGFAGMLFLNVFLPHLAATVFLRKYSPGVISGLLINLPLSALVLFNMVNLNVLTVVQLMISIVVGGIAGAFLAFIFLKFGKLIDEKCR